MTLFTIVTDAQVVIRRKGVFRQVPVYTRAGRLYAGHSGGFIGLRKDDNGTTVPDIKWEDLEGAKFHFDRMGVMHNGEQSDGATEVDPRVRREQRRKNSGVR